MDGAGGIANGGIATITLSQVDGNTAPGAAGGGILNHGTMTINRSQVDNNSAPNDAGLGGGGIANLDFGAVPITSSGSTPNTPSGVLTINLSQVDNNSAAGGMGGGILEAGATATFTFTLAGGPLALNGTQVTGNSSAAGGGIYATTGSPVTLLDTLFSTLIFGNNPDNCEPSGSITGCSG
jgi:predicted outer membrane repeat protein